MFYPRSYWLILFILLHLPVIGHTDTLDIGVLVFNDNRLFLRDIAREFEKRYPEQSYTITVKFDTDYKALVHKWLYEGGGPDVLHCRQVNG